jgi:vacuolar protein sorting-associated protein VTA1
LNEPRTPPRPTHLGLPEPGVGGDLTPGSWSTVATPGNETTFSPLLNASFSHSPESPTQNPRGSLHDEVTSESPPKMVRFSSSVVGGSSVTGSESSSASEVNNFPQDAPYPPFYPSTTIPASYPSAHGLNGYIEEFQPSAPNLSNIYVSPPVPPPPSIYTTTPVAPSDSPPNYSVYAPPTDASPPNNIYAPAPELTPQSISKFDISSSSPPKQTIYAPSPPKIPSPPAPLPAVELTPAIVKKAQKHCRFAISALDYEDAETARKELREALKMLGG